MKSRRRVNCTVRLLTLDSLMSEHIQERLTRLPDEEILRLLTTHFPDYRKEWVDLAQEELRNRGFVLRPHDTQLEVLTPTGQKLIYPKIQSDVGLKPQLAIESGQPESAAQWTPFTILLAALSAFGSLIVTGILSFILFQILDGTENPQNPFPDWLATSVAIVIVGIFIGIWKVLFALLVQRFDKE